MWLCVPCMHPPTYHWLYTCGRQPSILQPPWSGTLPLRTWIQPPAPAGDTPSHAYQHTIHQACKAPNCDISIGVETPLSGICYSRVDHSVLYLGQVEVGLSQQVGVMFGHQANNIIKHTVLLVHGDGEVRLLHCGKQPVCTHTHTQSGQWMKC